MAESCKDGIQTGNHYQSLALGETRTTGFRTDRREFLDRIDFEGKKVLDLGSNLGEISRAARTRGAYLVDGFEYDPFFVETAQLVNAYNNVTRVSFYERDITDPSSYTERYDIVLALSVFVYIESVLDRIADITDQVLVLETHRLDGDLESTYLEPVLRYFPYYRILGETEWGTAVDPSVRRAVIAFAKQESSLSAALKSSPPAELESQTNVILAAESAEQLDPELAPLRYVDVSRTARWYDRFFSTLQFGSAEELLAAVAGIQVDVDSIARSHDLMQKEVLSGWAYWLLYIKGYLQYVDTERVDSGNVYYDYLVRYFGPRGHDPGLCSALADPHTAAERVARRFRDFDIFRNHEGREPSGLDNIAPVTVILRDPPPHDASPVYGVGSDAPLMANIDGYHRLFLARLFGIEALRCEVVYEGLS